MTEQARTHLKKMLEMLEFNVWLELDEVSFPRYFDVPLRQASSAAAVTFAEQHGAVAIFLTNPRLVKFGRSYAKRGDDA